MTTLLTKIEQYDPNSLKLLLTHDGIDKDTKKQLKQYKKLSIDGNKVMVKYNYPKTKYADNNIGRVYAEKGLGLQMFERNIRACLGSKYYIDVDMMNAHTNIIKKIAVDNELLCQELTYYSQHTQAIREEIARDFNCDIPQAKQLLLVIMYGGKIRVDKNKRLSNIRREITQIANFIYDKYENIRKLTDTPSKDLNEFHNNLYQIIQKSDQVDEYDKKKASIMALVIQTEELKCNLALDESMTAQGRQVDVLIHDGCLVKKIDPLEIELPQEILRRAENDIYNKTGYEMTLVCKQMHSTFILDNNIPTVDFMNDSTAAKHLYRLIEGKAVYVKGDIWIFNEENGIWTDDIAYIRRLVDKHARELIFNLCNDEGKNSLIDYGGDLIKMDKMLKLLSNVCPIEHDFIEKNIDTSIGKLIFSDGIYDALYKAPILLYLSLIQK